MSLAPIAVFGYNRPDHLRKATNALVEYCYPVITAAAFLLSGRLLGKTNEKIGGAVQGGSAVPTSRGAV